MKYLKQFKGEDDWKEITYEEALKTVLGSYKDNAEVRSMLTIGNWIPCAFSFIQVFDDNGLTAAPGLYCIIP